MKSKLRAKALEASRSQMHLDVLCCLVYRAGLRCTRDGVGSRVEAMGVPEEEVEEGKVRD